MLKLRATEERHVTPLHQLVLKGKTWLQQSLNWSQFVESEDDTRRNVRRNMMLHQRGYTEMFFTFEQGEVAGVASLNRIELLNRAAYIGYWLGREHQDKGILSQALQALIHYYARRQEIRRFVTECRVDNARSNQMALCNGFQLEGRMQQAEFLNGDCYDVNPYACIIDGSSK